MTQILRPASRLLLPAAEGEVLTGADFAQAIAWLSAQANALNQLKQPTLTPAALEAISRQQVQLRGQATALIALRIQWTAGQARLEAEHINDALAYAKSVIDRVVRLRATLDALTAVTGFFGVVLAGNPVAILKAGVKLKKELDSVG